MSSKNNHRKRSRRSYHVARARGIDWHRKMHKTYFVPTKKNFLDRLKNLFKVC